jgi:broad specificity phosphatase PhoE
VSRARDSCTPVACADLKEFDAGALQGLLHHQIHERFPEFFDRELSEYADYSRWGGESYSDIVERVVRVRTLFEASHRKTADRVLVVGHGGFGTEVVKHLVCHPAPRSFNVAFGNCTAMLVRMSERFHTYVGRLLWQIPVEQMRQ